jgi:hypothetical protein
MAQDKQIEAVLQSVDSRKIAEQRHYEEEARRRDGLFYRIGEFDYARPRFLIDGFLPEGGLVILAGDPKVGKTAFASAIALAVAKGRPFAGLPVEGAAVLWLALEESFQERSAVMRAAKGYKRIPFYTNAERIAIDTEDGIADLDYWRMETGAKLLVVDPLHGAHSGRSLMDGWAARKTLMSLKRFCAASRVTALVLHHLAKRGAKRVAESVQLAAIATMVMILTSDSQTIPSPPGRGPVPEAKRKWTEVRETDTRKTGAPETGPNSQNQPTANPKVRSRGSARLITLDCMGRGDFANRTWHFLSRNPLDYKPLPQLENNGWHGQVLASRNPSSATTEDMAVSADTLTARIIQSLKGKKAKSAQYLADKLGMSVKTIRNELTSLKRLGLIIAEKLSYVTYYKLARIKR